MSRNARLGTTGSGFERLARQIDPAYSAQQKFATGSRTLQSALDSGTLTADRHAQLLQLLAQRYQQVPQQANAGRQILFYTNIKNQ